jgi:hypothetical protein
MLGRKNNKNNINMIKKTLIIPEKQDLEIKEVANAWSKEYGDVLSLGKFWDPPELNSKSITLYGNDTFCKVLEQKLGLILISPDDDLIVKIPGRFTKRKIEIKEIENINKFPVFIKPLLPKQFKANIYKNKEELLKECNGLELNTKVIQSEIVEIVAEARAFILDYKLLDCSIYEGVAEVKEAIEFVNSMCNEFTFPFSCVIDVGKIINGEWVFIETNSTWGAGLNGCKAEKVIRAIYNATKSINN